MKKVVKDSLVILPDGTVTTWNAWVPTDTKCADPSTFEEPPVDPEKEAMKRFFFPPSPEPTSNSERMCKEDGRCPTCGELGRIHMSTMICSVHGPY